ncbi:MAG: carbohydrate kinase family protein [Candidatus Magasanikbacteria bacterium]
MHDVITVGSATQDVFLRSSKFQHIEDKDKLEDIGFGESKAECFALGTKMEMEEMNLEYGGGAVNAAISFSKRDLKTKTLTKVGEDCFGDNIVDYLDEQGINVEVIRDDKNITGYSNILLMPNGARTVLVHRGAAEKISKGSIDIDKLKAHWFYISPSEMPYSTAEWLLKKLSKREKTVKTAMNPSQYYLDRGLKKLKPIFSKLDVLIMNKEEASYLTNVDYTAETRKMLRKLNKYTDAVVVVTEGAKGSSASDGRYIYEAGTYDEEEVVDRTGAGDAFGAGFVAGLIKEGDIPYAIKLATANATSVIESVGAHTGALGVKNFERRDQFEYLDLDIEPLV